MTDKPTAMFHINFTNSHYYTVPVLGMNCLFNFEMFLREGETYTRKTKRYKQNFRTVFHNENLRSFDGVTGIIRELSELSAYL